MEEDDSEEEDVGVFPSMGILMMVVVVVVSSSVVVVPGSSSSSVVVLGLATVAKADCSFMGSSFDDDWSSLDRSNTNCIAMDVSSTFSAVVVDVGRRRDDGRGDGRGVGGLEVDDVVVTLLVVVVVVIVIEVPLLLLSFSSLWLLLLLLPAGLLGVGLGLV